MAKILTIELNGRSAGEMERPAHRVSALPWCIAVLGIGYFSTIFTGPLPFEIVGIKIEHIVAIAVSFLGVLSVLFRGRIPRQAIYVSGSFFLLLFPSVLVAKHPGAAIGYYLAVGGYAFLFLGSPAFFGTKAKLVYRAIVIAGVLFAVGFALVCVYEFSDGVVRIRVSSLTDPNHTAFGLGALLIVLVGIRAHGMSFPKVLRIVAIVAVLFCLIALMSRTVIAGVPIAVMLAFLVVTAMHKGLIPFNGQIVVGLALGGTAVVLLALSDAAMIEPVRDKFVHTIDLFVREGRRASLISESMARYLENPQSVLWGIGYYSTNPHNEYVRYLTNGGPLGLLWLLGMLVSLYKIAVLRFRHHQQLFLVQNSLFWYTTIYLATYGHTKTLWIGPFFLVFHAYLLSSDVARSTTSIRMSRMSQSTSY